MDLLKERTGKLFAVFLASSIGSTMISTLYSTVDMLCVGHYAGSAGTAALALVNPFWPLMIAPGVLVGVGGSVMVGNRRGVGDDRAANEYFTVSAVFSFIASIIIMLAFLVFPRELIVLFGGNTEELIENAATYMRSIAFVSPTFTMCACLAALMRGDGEAAVPAVATALGGITNIVLDVLLVFDFGAGLGIFGAGLATSIGQTAAFLIIFSYYFRKRCRMRLCIPSGALRKLLQVVTVGVPAFITEISFGVVGTVYNKQILLHLDESYLAVYGVISVVLAMFYGFFASVGSAMQPVAVAAFAAGIHRRVRSVRRTAFTVALALSAVLLLAVMLMPLGILGIYMSLDAGVRAVGATAVRLYCLGIPFAAVNVVCTYYFQSTLKRRSSFAVSLLRGLLFPSLLCLGLPLVFEARMLFFAVPLAEALTLAIALTLLLTSLQKGRKKRGTDSQPQDPCEENQ